MAKDVEVTIKIKVPEKYQLHLLDNPTINKDELNDVLAEGAINALQKYYVKSIPIGVRRWYESTFETKSELEKEKEDNNKKENIKTPTNDNKDAVK